MTEYVQISAYSVILCIALLIYASFLVVNLTRGVTTEIDCSLVSTNPSVPYTYEWRMEAPTQSKILLRVYHSDQENTITAIDVDDINSTHVFPANASLDDGNDFVSTVIMAASFSDSSQSQDFIVIGRTLEDVGRSCNFNFTFFMKELSY